MTERALAHLEDAETAIMNYIARSSAMADDATDEDFPDALPMLFAVMRSIGRAAGLIESTE